MSARLAARLMVVDMVSPPIVLVTVILIFTLSACVGSVRIVLGSLLL